jgi:hypothetical protein
MSTRLAGTILVNYHVFDEFDRTRSNALLARRRDQSGEWRCISSRRDSYVADVGPCDLRVWISEPNERSTINWWRPPVMRMRDSEFLLLVSTVDPPSLTGKKLTLLLQQVLPHYT